MSTSGPRYHIPFPRNFLAVNTTPRKASNPAAAPVVAPTAEASTHTFLSNKPTGRSYSMSSDSSEGSSAPRFSPPASPPTKAVTSPALEQKSPVFLALNSKFTAPPTTAKELKPEKNTGGFLSNRH